MSGSLVIKAQGSGQIQFIYRTWDGIDKPEYTVLHEASIPEAEGLVSSLAKAIEVAKVAENAHKAARADFLRKELKRLSAELTRITGEPK